MTGGIGQRKKDLSVKVIEGKPGEKNFKKKLVTGRSRPEKGMKCIWPAGLARTRRERGENPRPRAKEGVS